MDWIDREPGNYWITMTWVGIVVGLTLRALVG